MCNRKRGAADEKIQQSISFCCRSPIFKLDPYKLKVGLDEMIGQECPRANGRKMKVTHSQQERRNERPREDSDEGHHHISPQQNMSTCSWSPVSAYLWNSNRGSSMVPNKGISKGQKQKQSVTV